MRELVSQRSENLLRDPVNLADDSALRTQLVLAVKVCAHSPEACLEYGRIIVLLPAGVIIFECNDRGREAASDFSQNSDDHSPPVIVLEAVRLAFLREIVASWKDCLKRELAGQR